jgi:hypothetical protein
MQRARMRYVFLGWDKLSMPWNATSATTPRFLTYRAPMGKLAASLAAEKSARESNQERARSG